MELKQAYQSIQPFRTQDEYLYAMKEDLAEWFNGLYDADIGVVDFYDRLEDGVLLCRHGNNVQRHILQTFEDQQYPNQRTDKYLSIYYRTNVRPGTFHSRDNVSNFIGWCRHVLRIPDTLLFETDDLVLRKNGRNVVLCLLEVARRGSRFGLPVPVLVQLEQEIDEEIAAEKEQNSSVCVTTKRRNPPIEVDMKSIDHLVRDALVRCTCPDQFPMIRVSDGKYRIGESQTTIFLRILRSHVMVRIGGGWDTLENYLNRHDPCRCLSKSAHGSLSAWSGERERKRENSTHLQQRRERNTSSTTFKTDRKISNTDTYAASTPNSGISTPVSRETSSLNGIIQDLSRDANPRILKREFDGVKPKSRDSGKFSNQSPLNARTIKSIPRSDKVLSSSASVFTDDKSARRKSAEERNLSLRDGDPGQFSRRRRTSIDFFHSESQVPPSPERRRSDEVGERGFRRSSSSGRARCCFNRAEGGTAAGTTDRRRALSRASSREKSYGEKMNDVLLVTRDKRGLHSVQDFHTNSSRSETRLIGGVTVRDRSANNASPRLSVESCLNPRSPMTDHPERRHRQQNGKILLPRKTLVLQRSLSESMEEREGIKRDDLPRGITQDRKRSSSFSAIGQIAKSDTKAGFDRYYSPTLKSESLLEECRRLELGIQNLINR